MDIYSILEDCLQFLFANCLHQTLNLTKYSKVFFKSVEGWESESYYDHGYYCKTEDKAWEGYVRPCILKQAQPLLRSYEQCDQVLHWSTRFSVGGKQWIILTKDSNLFLKSLEGKLRRDNQHISWSWSWSCRLKWQYCRQAARRSTFSNSEQTLRGLAYWSR